MNDIYIRPLDLPYSIYAVTVTDCDGNYNVYVNINRCPGAQDRSIKHELEHIKMCHLHNYEPVIFNEMQVEDALKRQDV